MRNRDPAALIVIPGAGFCAFSTASRLSVHEYSEPGAVVSPRTGLLLLLRAIRAPRDLTLSGSLSLRIHLRCARGQCPRPIGRRLHDPSHCMAYFRLHAGECRPEKNHQVFHNARRQVVLPS